MPDPAIQADLLAIAKIQQILAGFVQKDRERILIYLCLSEELSEELTINVGRPSKSDA